MIEESKKPSPSVWDKICVFFSSPGELRAAIRERDLQKVKALVKKGYDPEEPYCGCPPLATALYKGDPSIILFLVVDCKASANAPVNRFNHPKSSVIEEAIRFLDDGGVESAAGDIKLLMLHYGLPQTKARKKPETELLISRMLDLQRIREKWESKLSSSSDPQELQQAHQGLSTLYNNLAAEESVGVYADYYRQMADLHLHKSKTLVGTENSQKESDDEINISDKTRLLPDNSLRKRVSSLSSIR